VAGAINILQCGFTIRSAGSQDATALRMLLPELRNGAEYFVAVEGQQQLAIGAAAMTQTCRTQPITGPGIALEVIEPCRRQGVATRLLTHLENAARQIFAANGLYASKRVAQDSTEMQAWNWLGFKPSETVEEHVLPIAEFESRLGPLIDRMRTKGRIPANARIIPLYQANPARLLQLHLDQMGGDRRELYRKLQSKGPGAFHPRYSRVLLIDDLVKGCVLAHRTARHTARVDANIVEPDLRGGWANIWLKLEASRRALSLGIKEFTFTSFDHYADTRSFTEKLGGATIRRTALMVRPFAAAIHGN
jgi:GNAT superfamily N-acetyltransferase